MAKIQSMISKSRQSKTQRDNDNVHDLKKKFLYTFY